MARDPYLPRFCGLFSRLGYTGQSCNVVPTKAVHIFVPSQHLIQKVLHFVCEFRQSRILSAPKLSLPINPSSLDSAFRLVPASRPLHFFICFSRVMADTISSCNS